MVAPGKSGEIKIYGDRAIEGFHTHVEINTIRRIGKGDIGIENNSHSGSFMSANKGAPIYYLSGGCGAPSV
jgi:hypothetical protein